MNSIIIQFIIIYSSFLYAFTLSTFYVPINVFIYSFNHSFIIHLKNSKKILAMNESKESIKPHNLMETFQYT